MNVLSFFWIETTIVPLTFSKIGVTQIQYFITDVAKQRRLRGKSSLCNAHGKMLMFRSFKWCFVFFGLYSTGRMTRWDISKMYTPVRNSKGANRDQIVHDRVFFLCPCRQRLSTVCLKSYIPKCMHVLYKKLTASVSFKRLKFKCNAETFNDRQRKKE